MTRQALLIGTLLLLLVTAAEADRLGGAYRGPFEFHDGPPPNPPGFLPKNPIKVTMRENLAFWPFFYEHNKEWILRDRITARRALARGETGVVDPKVVDRVLVVLAAAPEDAESCVRDAAIIALGKTGREDAVPLLATRLKTDPKQSLREDALLALGLTGQEIALPLLRAALPDDRYGHYPALGLALARDRESVPVLLTRYAEVLKKRDDEAAGTLARNEGKWYTTCGAAAIALGLIADDAAVEPLLKLAAKAEIPRTRAFAIAALGWFVDQDPVPRIPLLFERINYRVNTCVFRAVMRIL